MSLLAASALNPSRFFKTGSQPVIQGSSFDLTIGTIFDHDGRKVTGPFVLKPGHMVQVVSAEIFDLPDDITGHVTYKTSLTSKGIWALTVGIVDPGWDGPISTTLLNFSRIDYPVTEGNTFLRVSFFEHASVSKLRKEPTVDGYLKRIQESAATIFPQTFLDHSNIAVRAGETAINKMQDRGLIWITVIAFIFTFMQLVGSYAGPSVTLDDKSATAQAEIDALSARVQRLEDAQTTKLSPPASNVSPTSTQAKTPTP